jgi:hypothetical protein
MHYSIRFGRLREMEMGAIDQSPETDVERRLFKGFKKENEQGKFYEGKELFTAWREEAKGRGWDADRVDSLLSHAADLYQEKLERIYAQRGPFEKVRVVFSDCLQKMTTREHEPERKHETPLDKEPTRSR